MRVSQPDLFAQDDAERNMMSDAEKAIVRARLDATLARLAAAPSFPWKDPLDAVHEENRFERESQKLGKEGAALWAQFDREMDRLYDSQWSDEEAASGVSE